MLNIVYEILQLAPTIIYYELVNDAPIIYNDKIL